MCVCVCCGTCYWWSSSLFCAHIITLLCCEGSRDVSELQVKEILQEEEDLSEIVQLVGKVRTY